MAIQRQDERKLTIPHRMSYDIAPAPTTPPSGTSLRQMARQAPVWRVILRFASTVEALPSHATRTPVFRMSIMRFLRYLYKIRRCDAYAAMHRYPTLATAKGMARAIRQQRKQSNVVACLVPIA